MRLKRIGIMAGALVAIWFVAVLALHFGQIRHDRLDYQVDRAFPPEKPFISGEIYATTLAELMDHELHSGFGWRPNDFFLWGPHVTGRQQLGSPIGHHHRGARNDARLQGSSDEDFLE